MKTAHSFKRRTADIMTSELASVLSSETWFDFKALFLEVHANLRARGAAHGGEEILRLRAYDKLQGLVQEGNVEKKVKSYRGNRLALSAFTEQMAKTAAAAVAPKE
jgi:hypothetical protein